MSKRIVFCADGTWQNAVNNTNVYRLYKAFTLSSDQVTYYDDGVGADLTGLNKVLGGAFGQGLIQKIKDGYTKIAHVFEMGDEIFLFGFSRGAYTVRSLAGMIANCGLPTGSFSDDCVEQAFSAYRDPVNRAAILAGMKNCGLGDATIRMVGSMGHRRLAWHSCDLWPDRSETVRLSRYRPAPRRKERLSLPGHRRAARAVPRHSLDLGSRTRSDHRADMVLRLSRRRRRRNSAGRRLSTLEPASANITLGYMAAKAQALGLTMDPTVAAQFATLPPCTPSMRFASRGTPSTALLTCAQSRTTLSSQTA